MKAVLISIQPKWCELIASGKKTVEVRKTKPKLETPFKCYIYETKDKKFEHIGVVGYRTDGTKYNFLHRTGKVIGEFVCDRIELIGWASNPTRLDWKNAYNKHSCLTNNELYEYTKGKLFYEWHISDLVIYDKPRELSEFRSYNVRAYIDENGYPMPTHEITRPPQSWCYVERSENGKS